MEYSLELLLLLNVLVDERCILTLWNHSEMFVGIARWALLNSQQPASLWRHGEGKLLIDRPHSNKGIGKCDNEPRSELV